MFSWTQMLHNRFFAPPTVCASTLGVTLAAHWRH